MIDVNEITFQYPGAGKPIFEGHSFSVGKGEVLAILGPNGSGKTTLIKTLLGLLPLNSGRVSISGHCSYVPQNTLSPFEYSVGEMVLMGASGQNGLFATPSKRDKSRTEQALDQVGMRHYIHSNFTHLSGGQKQLILIARALVSEPDVMVLDEPTSALDYHNQDKVLQTMMTVSRSGKTVLFTTHCPHQALHIADKVLLVKENSAGIFGYSEDILQEEYLSQLYELPIVRHTLEHGDIIVPRFRYNARNNVIRTDD